ncbi:MAG: hypothetical protein P4L87_07345 [Formivibrio sp.]|nr:hypothetical protein [Formivibrio sp.]
MLPRKCNEFAPPWRWGIFLRKPCAGLLLDRSSSNYEPMQAIYRALKNVGFRETYWQFVYPGQIGGLIKSPRNNLVEFHVRFFDNGMIYAEFELGRSALLHFLGHRLYLNRYIAGKIQSQLSVDQISYWQTAVQKYKSFHPRKWPEWGADNRFMTLRIKRQLKFFATLSDWRVLATIMFASVIATMLHGPIVLPIIVAVMVIVYLLAPRRA